MNYIRYILLFLPTLIFAQQPNTQKWFEDAKLGIFIHWGMYAVDGTSESWAFHNRTVPYAQYMSQMKGLSAKNYHPEQWAALIKESGARYCVITTKHHDGLALYDTKMRTASAKKNTNWNTKLPLSTVNQSPCKQDLIAPFFTELKKVGIHTGAYYSLLDWSSNDYPGFLKDSSRYQINEDMERWQRFLNFMHGQITELASQYNPDLYWFDGDWEHSETEWQAQKIDSIIHHYNSAAILNGRLKSYGDYDTPEQNMPLIHPDRKTWELCLTTNDNWGYRPSDHNFKSHFELLSIFTECLNMGGNLLLDIGPKADGTIPDEQVAILKEFGRWTQKHAAAIYGTTAGLPYGHYHGNSTLTKDSSTLYLFVPSPQGSDLTASELKTSIYLKGIKSKPQSIKLVGTNFELEAKEVGKISWSSVPGTLFIDIPNHLMDPMISVIEIKFNEPIQLYRGKGGFH
ncbi:MAG: alpha-L-fucosidase [Flavobacteriales bacterium]